MLCSSYGTLREMKRLIAYIVMSLCVILVLFAGYVNIDTIVGAFGDGSPYYGRTTNMDKWENPIPTLVAIDTAVAVIVFLAAKWVRRRDR